MEKNFDALFRLVCQISYSFGLNKEFRIKPCNSICGLSANKIYNLKLFRIQGIYSMDNKLSNQKTTRQLQEEREERERLEMIKQFKDGSNKEAPSLDSEKNEKSEKDVSQMDLEGKEI